MKLGRRASAWPANCLQRGSSPDQRWLANLFWRADRGSLALPDLHGVRSDHWAALFLRDPDEVADLR